MISVEFPKLYPWQEEVFAAIKNDDGKGNFYVVKARRQCGKSILAINALLYFALKSRSIGTCLEPTQSQCRRVFKQIVNAVGGTESPLLKSANSTLLEMEFSNGSQIIFKSAEQGDALRGITVKHSILVIDEAAFIQREIFEILYAATDALRCPILMISTPQFESGEFYEKFIAGKNGQTFVKSYDWADYDTSALLSKEKLEYYRETMSPIKFRSEYLALFITDKSYVFGDFTKCYGYSKKEPKYVGIDWATGANEKDDYSCMVFMDEDGAMVDIKFWRVTDPMDMVAAMAAVINSIPSISVVLVEKNSLGEVYRSALNKALKNKAILKSFITSNESKRDIIEQLIKAFAEGTVTILDEARLKEQLQHYEIEQTPTGKITYNAQSGFCDDAVIALALAYQARMKYKNTGRNNFVIL